MEQLNSNQHQEVDLIDVARIVIKWLQSLCKCVWSAFVYCVIYLIRKSLWLILFMAIGVGVAVSLYKSTAKFYASSAILRSNNQQSSIVIGNMEKLNYLFDKKDYAELASLLSISEDDAAKIKSLTGYYGVNQINEKQLPAYYVRTYDPKDTSLSISSTYFKVNAEVYNEDIYPALSKSLLTYISRSNFSQQLNALRESQVKEQMGNADHEIAAMQHAMNSYNFANKQMPLIANEKQKSELVQMQEALSKLYATKSELERQSLLFATPATIVDDFSKSYRTANSLIRNYIEPGVAIAFAFGLLGLIVWDNRKRIAAAICEKK